MRAPFNQPTHCILIIAHTNSGASANTTPHLPFTLDGKPDLSTLIISQSHYIHSIIQKLQLYLSSSIWNHRTHPSTAHISCCRSIQCDARGLSHATKGWHFFTVSKPKICYNFHSCYLPIGTRWRRSPNTKWLWNCMEEVHRVYGWKEQWFWSEEGRFTTQWHLIHTRH